MQKLFVLSLVLAALTGCSKNNSPVSPVAPSNGMGQFRVLITDAPAHVDAVNLVVAAVRAHHSSAADESGWEVLSTDTTQIDLLSFQNGAFAPLADTAIPAGGYDALRLLLTDGCTVVVDGVTYPLDIPSGMTSGLKLNGNFDLPAGGVLTLQLDFDASRSLNQTGNGQWKLQPVVRLLDAQQAGSIHGVVVGGSSGVDVIQGGSVVTTVVPGSGGGFTAGVLPAGTYDLLVHGATGNLTLTGVVVNAGSVTDVGVIGGTGGHATDTGGGSDLPRDLVD